MENTDLLEQGYTGGNPPFNAQEAARSIVRVLYGHRNWGCGFVAAGQYVITAAHCLPRIPADHFDEVPTTVISWDRKDKANLVVIYCDPISDIAVLSNETLSGGSSDAWMPLIGL